MQNRTRMGILGACLAIVGILALLFTANEKVVAPAQIVDDPKLHATIEIQKQQILALSDELRDHQLHKLTSEEKLNAKELEIVARGEQLKSLQAKLERAESSLKTYEEDSSKEQLIKRVAELEEQLEVELIDCTRLAHYKKESELLRRALKENAETISLLDQRLSQKEHTIQSAVAMSENSRSSRDKLEAELKEVKQQLTAEQKRTEELLTLEEKLKEEALKTQEKEAYVEQMRQDIQAQRLALQKVEQARQELESSRRSYDKITEEMQKTTPDRKVVLAEPVVHLVQPGETLMTISDKYYGTTKKWKLIYEANLSQLDDQNRIRPGMELLVP